MPLITSLFYYPMLKHTKLEAVDGLKNITKTAPSWSPVSKHYLGALLCNNETSFFPCLFQYIITGIVQNIFIFFSIYPASAPYSIHHLGKKAVHFIFAKTTKNSKNREHDAFKIAIFLKYILKHYFLVLCPWICIFRLFQRQKFSWKVKKSERWDFSNWD